MLDLWQAGSADDPCEAFAKAIEAAAEHLMGSLSSVSAPETGEGDEAAACPGLQAKLEETRDDYAQRYAGLDPSIPSEFRRRPTRRRRR